MKLLHESPNSRRTYNCKNHGFKHLLEPKQNSDLLVNANLGNNVLEVCIDKELSVKQANMRIAGKRLDSVSIPANSIEVAVPSPCAASNMVICKQNSIIYAHSWNEHWKRFADQNFNRS